MSKVTLDAATLAKLGGLTGPVELYDEAGNLVARCEPVGRPASGWGPFTVEQVERAKRRSGPYRTLDDIFREYGHL